MPRPAFFQKLASIKLPQNRQKQKTLVIVALLLILVLAPAVWYISKNAKKAQAATMSLASDGTSYTISVDNRYQAILQKGDTDDFLTIYDKSEDNSTPDDTHVVHGPYFNVDGDLYMLQDDDTRSTTVLETTSTRIKLRVSGRFGRTDTSAYRDSDSGENVTVDLNITFTPTRIIFQNIVDFKDGTSAPVDIGGQGFYSVSILADRTGAAFDESANIIYGDGGTEGTRSTDGSIADTNTYVVLPGNGSDTYQDVMVVIPPGGWPKQFDSTRTSQWNWDIDCTDSFCQSDDDLLTVLVNDDSSVDLYGNATSMFYLEFRDENDLDTEAEREGLANDIRNTDYLDFSLGSQWQDYSGPGTAVGWFDDIFGSYDGYISVTDADNSLDITGDMTLEAWVLLSRDTTDYVSIFGKGNSGSNRGNYFLEFASGNQLGFSLYASSNWRDTGYDDVAVPVNQWTHVAAVLDTNADTVTLYRNGEDIGGATSFTWTPVANNDPLVMGAYEGPSGYLYGIVDEVRVWNVARTQEEITSDMGHSIDPNSSGLVGYWKLDEGYGTTVYDEKGNNPGTITNSNWMQGRVATQFNKSEWAYTVDLADTNIASFQIDGGPNASTLLNGALSAAATTVTVDTSGSNNFNSNGVGYMQGDKFSYTGTTSTTFTGVPSTGDLAVIGHADNTVVASMNRHDPFFKLRNWRGLGLPDNVTLNGNILTLGSDYNASVKPITSAYFAQDLNIRIPFESDPGGGSCDSEIGQPSTCSGTGSWGATGKYGQGYLIDEAGDSLTLNQTDLNFTTGTIEFWYQSVGTPTSTFPFFKPNSSSTTNLYRNSSDTSIILNRSGTTITWTLTADLYDGSWHHFRFSYDTGNDTYVIYIDGLLQDSIKTTALSTFGTDSYRVGTDNSTQYCNCIVDELKFYNSYSAPVTFAAGGDISDSNEYLNDETNNYTLDMSAVDSTSRGEYVYFGSDSPFQGLNIDLATAGVKSDNDMTWEYWDSRGWSTLTTNEAGAGVCSFQNSGTCYWTAPGNWLPYTVSGPTELYYIRGHIPNGSGSFTTDPVESTIKTDILLVNYLNDLTAEDQTFAINITGDDTESGGPPVTIWGMNENYGSTTYDTSVFTGNDLTITNAAWTWTGDELLPKLVYLQFDGSGDYLSRSHDGDFDFDTGSFTITGWFKHSSNISGTDYLLANFDDAGYKIYMNSSGYLCLGIDADSTWSPTDSVCTTSSLGSLADSRWHHFAAVKSGTASITMYIDGLQASQNASLSATSSLNTDSSLYIGNDTDGGSNGWVGFLDQIVVYNYARSAAQVKVDHNGGTANFGP